MKINLNNLKQSLKELTLLPDNSNIKKIFDLVKKEKLNITEISNKINLSYKNTLQHIKKLEKYDLIKRDIKHNTRGQEVYIIPSGKTLKEFEKEQKEIIIIELKKVLAEMKQ